MKSKVIYRAAQDLDQNAIVTFQMAMALETENLKLDLGACTQGVRALFENPHRGKYYVAERGDAVIGSILIIPEWSDWRNGEVWWIHSVYLIPEERGNKIFSSFYKFIQTLALSDKGIRGLRLYVDKTNLNAQAVYKKLGMSNHHYDLYEWMATTAPDQS